jgi:hypothetical protein
VLEAEDAVDCERRVLTRIVAEEDTSERGEGANQVGLPGDWSLNLIDIRGGSKHSTRHVGGGLSDERLCVRYKQSQRCANPWFCIHLLVLHSIPAWLHLASRTSRSNPKQSPETPSSASYDEKMAVQRSGPVTWSDR